MTTERRQHQHHGISDRTRRNAFIAATICILINIGSVLARDNDDDDRDGARTGAYCSATADLLFRACGAEGSDDYFKAQALCVNVSDDAARKTCLNEAKTVRREGSKLCNDQLVGRHEACKSLGEGRFDPTFEPSAFDVDFTHPVHINPYFPLKIGHKWEYLGDSERVKIEILNRTKLIQGVTCVVFRDRVFKDGQLAEDTDDWFAQAKNGDVYYCGEEVKDYEHFDGDKPKVGELVKIDGSFKWGRNGDKGGIFFRGLPRKGEVYREEFSPRNAEDVSEVLSTSYQFGLDTELDRHVPPHLVNLLCHGDCIVTKNLNLNEPSALARKFYARGIGNILEVNMVTGETVQLINCNFDTRCASLPKP